MTISKDAHRLKELIIQAIDDENLTCEEYDSIIDMASADGVIDSHEQALLNQLQEMIENKTVKLTGK